MSGKFKEKPLLREKSKTYDNNGAIIVVIRKKGEKLGDQEELTASSQKAAPAFPIILLILSLFFQINEP